MLERTQLDAEEDVSNHWGWRMSMRRLFEEAPHREIHAQPPRPQLLAHPFIGDREEDLDLMQKKAARTG